MDAYEPLIEHVKKRVALTADEISQLTASFKLKKVKKRQLIIQPEFVARHRNYIVRGSFRAYVLGENGEDHTIQLAIEDWWTSDYNSYIYQTPATMFVMALEDGIILQIEHTEEQRLKRTSHTFETFFRIMAERTAAYHQRRIISNLTQTAEERYQEFIRKYPLLVARMPQYAIASFLGMTTEFLSKIRNNKVKKRS